VYRGIKALIPSANARMYSCLIRIHELKKDCHGKEQEEADYRFWKVGKKTKVFARFSKVGCEKGSAATERHLDVQEVKRLAAMSQDERVKATQE